MRRLHYNTPTETMYSVLGGPLPDLFGAACYNSGVDPDEYFPFPKRHGRGQYKMLKEICNKCPVQVQCLDYAIKYNESWGIWGGKTPKERERIKKEREESAKNITAPVGRKFPAPNWRGIEATSKGA